jgi:hypothetical protein
MIFNQREKRTFYMLHEPKDTRHDFSIRVSNKVFQDGEEVIFDPVAREIFLNSIPQHLDKWKRSYNPKFNDEQLLNELCNDSKVLLQRLANYQKEYGSYSKKYNLQLTNLKREKKKREGVSPGNDIKLPDNVSLDEYITIKINEALKSSSTISKDISPTQTESDN